MPRLTKSDPKYRLHKQSGRALVTLDGRDFLLPAPYGSDASRAEYDRLVGEWRANGRRLSAVQAGPTDWTVDEVMAKFWVHANGYYRKNGRPTSEVECLKTAFRPLSRLYGHTLARDFGPLALKGLRTAMIEQGWCRASINQHIGRVRNMFGWAVSEELVPASLAHALREVRALGKGRSAAWESEPVTAVPERDLADILPHMPPTVRALVDLQLWSGCRPGEAVSMRGADLDMTGTVVAGIPVWVYTPAEHKTEHHEKDRIIFLGPKAQAIIRPRLKADPLAPLFTSDAPRFRAGGRPFTVNGYRQAIGQAWEQAALVHVLNKAPERLVAIEAAAAARRAGENAYAADLAARPGRMEKGKRRTGRAEAQRAAGQYLTLLREAIEVLDGPRYFHPHRLRHNAAERLELEHGIEAAQYVLGHSSVDMTRIYSQANRRKAAAVMQQSG